MRKTLSSTLRLTALAALLGWTVVLAVASADEGRERPVVGAIRWDAWTGGAVTEQVERTLGPKRYHDRLPWFAEVVGDNEIRIDGGRQTVMDREIEFAADAGLDYWAFLLYPESSPMSTALKQYLRSQHRDRINFCLILHNTLGVRADDWPEERDRAISLMKEPGDQTVPDGRPLVYAFTGRGFPFGRFAEFLAAAEDTGLDPYCVFMGWNPPADFRRVSPKGFDAVSVYAKGGSQPEFRKLAEAVEKQYWQRARKAGVPYVPLVTTGWDKRPRQDHPVAWEKDHAYHDQEVFPSRAKPEQIADHLRRAISFLRSNREICEANAVIIYAWNEYDEGGWIAPTRDKDGTPDTSRLDAICRVLKKNNEADGGAEAEGPPRVTAPPESVRTRLDLSPFYKKYLSAKGLPVVASGKVSDEAVREAAAIVNHMLADRDDIRQAIIENKVRVVVMAPTEMTTDVPEHSDLKPKEYWNKRARGLGATHARPAISCGEENLLNLEGDRYPEENILIHEFAHTVHQMGLNSIDDSFDRKLRAAYKAAMDEGLWEGTYAATNRHEYWAEGVQTYFDCNDANNSQHNDIDTREELAEYDPALFKLIDTAFRGTDWRYERYDERHSESNGEKGSPHTPIKRAKQINQEPSRGAE